MSDKGRKHTEEELAKMREWHRNNPSTPEDRERRRKVWLGRKHTEETKAKMRESVHKADLVGKKFGRLTVLSLDHISPKQRQTSWLCRCDCGNEKVVSIGRLISGYTKSCGCLRREVTSELGKKGALERGKAAANSVLYGYKRTAMLRNLSWELNDEEFFDLISKNCHYCNDPPNTFSHRSSTFNGGFIHNGIDRVDNTLGYTKENCVTCCKHCNYAKRNLSYDDFISLIRKICENLNLGGTS